MPNNRGQERPHKGALQETITSYSTDQALILLEGSLAGKDALQGVVGMAFLIS